MNDKIITIGLISDTHGLLRNSAVKALTGVDMIIHAGDLDNIIVLDTLELIAPVYAVRGNMDVKPGVTGLPTYLEVMAGPEIIGVIHNRHFFDSSAAKKGLSVIIHGHTHKPAIEKIGEILFINPGSAGPGRPRLPVSMGILELNNGRFTPRIITLDA